jgi:hypothetical protein
MEENTTHCAFMAINDFFVGSAVTLNEVKTAVFAFVSQFSAKFPAFDHVGRMTIFAFRHRTHFLEFDIIILYNYLQVNVIKNQLLKNRCILCFCSFPYFLFSDRLRDLLIF